MSWTQTYDPLGHAWLSTVCAALPIVALLGSLAFLRLRAHTAALIGLGTSVAHGYGGVRHAAQHGRGERGVRRRLRAAAHRLDRAERHLPVPADGRTRPLRHAAPEHHARDDGCAAAAAAGGVCLRCVLRGRRRVRHARRRDRRAAHRPGLRAPGGIGPLAHRQHRAGGIRSPRHTAHRAQRGERPRPPRLERHGGPAAPFLLGARPVLAGRRLRWMARDAWNLAGDPHGRRAICRTAVPRLEPARTVARRCRRLDHLDGRARALPARLAPAGRLGPWRDASARGWTRARPCLCGQRSSAHGSRGSS